MKKKISIILMSVLFALIIVSYSNPVLASYSPTGPKCSDLTTQQACESSAISGCCYYDTYSSTCKSVTAGSPGNCDSSYSCFNQEIIKSICDGTHAFCGDTTGNICAGDCNSVCVNGQNSCADTSAGQDTYGVCLGNSPSYTCSGQDIINMSACSAGTTCGYPIGECMHNCQSVCVQGQSTCNDTQPGQDPYGVCASSSSTDYTCDANQVLDKKNNSLCGTSASCGYKTTTACNSECTTCTPGQTSCSNITLGNYFQGYSGAASNTDVFACGGADGQTIINTVKCDGAGNKGVVVDTCLNTHDSICKEGFGTCQSSCGDNICETNMGEDYQTCFKDCFNDGWTTKDTGWSLLDNNTLHANASKIVLISTYSIDLKANKTYTLSYDMQSSNSNCEVYFDFNNGTCTSAEDSTSKVCFYYLSLLDFSKTTQPETIYVESNSNAINGIYFKNVKLRLITGAGCTNVSIENLSLVESTYYTDEVAYNFSALPASGEAQATGCCPSNYCWNGTTCLNSVLWMTNASYQGIWNNVLDLNWTNQHVDTANQSQATSYRCVIVNDTSNEAQWMPSKIKYDWNYEISGYCALDTDCFVNFSYERQPNYYEGCIHNGEVISDTYTLGQGNHYCYMGNWTTRSYIVATLLQNISGNNAFTLQCYDNTSITYNLNPDTANLDTKVLSSCVLVMKKSLVEEQVITGDVLVGDSGGSNNAKDFLDILKSEYKKMYDVDVTPTYACLTDPTLLIQGTNFTKCIDANHLKAYYEMHYNYFIVSDRIVDGVEKPVLLVQIWDNIVGFFKGLFGSTNVISEAFKSTTYSTNYDRIYVMRNQTSNVTAIEESKYDEAEKAIATVLYVRYSGSNNNNNPLYTDLISKNVNETMIEAGRTNISVLVGSNATNNNEQELIIKSQDRSGLWKYFTSTLRVK